MAVVTTKVRTRIVEGQHIATTRGPNGEDIEAPGDTQTRAVEAVLLKARAARGAVPALEARPEPASSRARPQRAGRTQPGSEVGEGPTTSAGDPGSRVGD